MNKDSTFYEILQKDKEIDLRDNRGKQHNLALILVEFIIALLCNRDGKLSSIHRHMKAHHTQVVAELALEDAVPKKQYRERICQYY